MRLVALFAIVAALVVAQVANAPASAQSGNFPTTEELNAARANARSDPALKVRLAEQAACREGNAACEKAKTARHKAACALKAAADCLDYGDALMGRATVTTYTEMDASDAYRKACDYGSAAGCREFGKMVQVGRGTRPDAPRAVTLFEQACTAKDGEGCYFAGKAYTQGEGNSINAAKATTLFKAGCALSYRVSCQTIGSPMPGSQAAAAGGPAPKPKITGIAPLKNARIDGAIASFTPTIADHGFRLVSQTDLREAFFGFYLNLSPTYDYVFFAACGETCSKMLLTVIAPNGVFRTPANRLDEVPTKSVTVRAPPAGRYQVSLAFGSWCTQKPCYARLAMYRRDHAPEAASPSKP